MMKSFYAAYNARQFPGRAVFVLSEPTGEELYARLYERKRAQTGEEMQTTPPRPNTSHCFEEPLAGDWAEPFLMLRLLKGILYQVKFERFRQDLRPHRRKECTRSPSPISKSKRLG